LQWQLKINVQHILKIKTDSEQSSDWTLMTDGLVGVIYIETYTG